jgi:hypothetical protein
MKRITILLSLLLLGIYANSQDLKFGVYFSPNIAWLSPESKDVKGNGSIVRFSGGLNIENYFAKNYAFATGIGIGGQGGKLIYDGTSNNELNVYDSAYNLAGKEVKYTFQYINIPLGLKLRSNEIGYMRFHVVVGFTNQFNIKARASDETAGDFNDDSIKDEISLYNLGYHFGGGIDYALGEDTSLSFTIVYDNGFIDVFKPSPRISSRVVSLRMGITF